MVGFPVAEYNEDATFQAQWVDGLIRETLEHVQPRSTEDALNFPATYAARADARPTLRPGHGDRLAVGAAELMPTADVLVIGSGPAGINAAYALRKAGIEYRIIDRSHTLATTLEEPLPPPCALNTSRFFSELPGRKFPLHWGIFPTAPQYHRYLTDWVADQQLPIEPGIEVHRVAPRADGLWQVETSQGIETYRAVIPATGVFDNPAAARD